MCAKRLEGDEHDDGGTVWVGDEAVSRIAEEAAIDLRDDEGDVGIGTKGRRVVDHGGTGAKCVRDKFMGDE